MKTTYTIIGIAVLAALGFTLLRVQNIDSKNTYVVDQSDMYTVDEQTATSTDSVLTDKETNWLIHMREEEKLARDVYLTLGNTWGLQIFANISASEQTHTDSVKTLLQRYQITDPVTSGAVGSFTSKDFQQLYADLVAKGSVSKASALEVGATIEDLDIHDLDTALSDTKSADIVQVYQNLQKGSRNHMRAFVRNISMQGGVYKPQYISEDAFNTIINSQQERGRI